MRRTLVFTAPREVTVQEEELPAPGPGELAVRVLCSAISAGTELLMYRGEVEPGTLLDDTIPSLRRPFAHPFKYGYATVGEVTAVGKGASCDWVGKRVFVFHSHEGAFNVAASEAMAVPPGIGSEDAVMLPSMETALSLVMDSAPLVGEAVVVLGQGVIGLLTTAILSRFPLSRLATADRYPLRRRASLEMGADRALDPGMGATRFLEEAGLTMTRADLIIELSGRPEALELATHLVGMEGRVVVGSRYGSKGATACLGDDFHRHRLHIISSQVSHLSGGLSPRWNKARRTEVAWAMVRSIHPSRLITHRFDIAEAAEAYRLIDERGEETMQVLLTYPEG